MTALFLLLGLASVVFVVVSFTTLTWMLYAWRTPEGFAQTAFPQLRTPVHSFSLIVPARHEQRVLDATLRRLARTAHPDVEILAVVGHDDPGTEEVARRVASQMPSIHVVVDDNWPKNKPLALNTALAFCTGDVVGVFDAEDQVPPHLLPRVDALLQDSGADVVQCGVQLMNYWSSWYAVRNVLEYYFWFRSRLHHHAAMRFIPLGGNTVFFRTEVLRKIGGWDAGCLAEDCDVGVRLSADGYRVAVAYEPALVTREETPGSLASFLKQRTRWNQGFIQVLRKRDWSRLPSRRRRLFALYTLTMPLLQALSGALVLPSIVASLLLNAPMPLALLSFAPLIPVATVVVVELVGLREFGTSFGQRIRIRDYLRLVIGAPAYQLLLAFAALRALWREARGEYGWEKTAHAGAHLADQPT